jgi:hypothetical protein
MWTESASWVPFRQASWDLAAERDWQDVPGVRVVGAILGVLLIVAAIRALFGRRK